MFVMIHECIAKAGFASGRLSSSTIAIVFT